MLFSRKDVSDLINASFEPVWQSVRPVPMVTIDFGNGKVIKRTLHGNIATYVCTPDAQILDVAPGIYTPEGYLDRLKQFSLLVQYVASPFPPQRQAKLREYHQAQIKTLTDKGVAARLQLNPRAFVSKRKIENPIKLLVEVPHAEKKSRTEKVSIANANDVAHWKSLVEDTEINETVRRLHLHKMLLANPGATPAKLTKPIYKEVLHADLDDPYLGLGAKLFASYPFKDK